MNDVRPTAGERLRKPPRDPAFAIIEPALKVGALCGGAGFLVGGTAGILKGTTPFLFASASGLQTFALGTTFWGCRSTILEAWTSEHQKPVDLIKASTISGGFTGGAIAALTRGRSNVLPATLMFSLFGFLGQTAYNRISTRRTVEVAPKEAFWKRLSDKKWSPMQIMNDEEYAELLKEKVMKVDVEIAVIEDKIAALQELQEQQDEKSSASTIPEK